MAEQRTPGWYDDGHGQTRWWSGRGWTTHTQAGPTVEAPTVQTPRLQRTAPVDLVATDDRIAPRRRFRGRTLLITAGVAAVLGLGIGAGAGGGAPTADPTAGPEYVALQARLTSAVSERDELQQKADDASDQVAAMTDTQATLEAASDRLDVRSSALDRREARLDKRAKSLKAASVVTAAPEKAASTVTSELEEEAAPVSVYYQNCDAARAAGAAPVHRGDAGYASHLDRDGDGVGCE